jgi:CheY-like chemotaxis protein
VVVDDDADWRDLLSVELSAYSAAVTTAASPQAALAVMSAAGAGRPMVIIADMALAGESGVAFLERVACRRSDARGRSSNRDLRLRRTRQRGPGACRRFKLHLGKPLAPHAVATAVLELLRSEAGR